MSRTENSVCFSRERESLISEVIESGLGKGAFFTSLARVVNQFERVMGFKPFPGTHNVRVIESDLSALKAFLAEKDFELVPDGSAFCTAWLKKVRVSGIPAVAVFPGEDVKAHSREVIE